MDVVLVSKSLDLDVFRCVSEQNPYMPLIVQIYDGGYLLPSRVWKYKVIHYYCHCSTQSNKLSLLLLLRSSPSNAIRVQHPELRILQVYWRVDMTLTGDGDGSGTNAEKRYL